MLYLYLYTRQVDPRSARLSKAMQQLRTQHVAVQLPALEHNGEASALQASVLLNPLSKASHPMRSQRSMSDNLQCRFWNAVTCMSTL